MAPRVTAMMLAGTGSISTSSRSTNSVPVLVTTPLIDAAEYLAHFVTHSGRPGRDGAGAWTDEGMSGRVSRKPPRDRLHGRWRAEPRRWGRMAPDRSMPEGR